MSHHEQATLSELTTIASMEDAAQARGTSYQECGEPGALTGFARNVAGSLEREADLMSKSKTVWMEPPREFSMGKTAVSASHCAKA